MFKAHQEKSETLNPDINCYRIVDIPAIMRINTRSSMIL